MFTEKEERISKEKEQGTYKEKVGNGVYHSACQGLASCSDL